MANGQKSPSLELSRKIDAACDTFESQWRDAMSAWDGLIDDEVNGYIRQAGPAVVVPDWE